MYKQAYEASVMMVLEKRAALPGANNVIGEALKQVNNIPAPKPEGANMPKLSLPPIQPVVSATPTPLSPVQQGLNTLRQMPYNMRYATSNLLHQLGGNANPPSGTVFRETKPQPPRNWFQRRIQPLADAFDKYSGRDRELHQMRAAEAEALQRTQEEAFKRKIRGLEQESEKMRNDAWSNLLPEGSAQNK